MSALPKLERATRRLPAQDSLVRVLKGVDLTAEQLKVLDYRPGFTVIRGAAGSGKTTTGVLRLRRVAGVWGRQRERTGSQEPIRVLVLTYNRTLEGYISELVADQVNDAGVQLKISTFARWAKRAIEPVTMVDDHEQRAKIVELGRGLGYEPAFLLDEVSYVLGRFLPADLGDYADPTKATYERTGRGASPRVERPQRERILLEVVAPYLAWKVKKGQVDWNDVAVKMIEREPDPSYDIVIVDEAQDFSANQVRAVVRHLAPEHSTAFVLDAVQRIYPHGFASWQEVGVAVAGVDSFQLKRNHRNTESIARFALPLVEGLPVEADGTLPNLDQCERVGERPKVVRGLFSDQFAWVIDRIKSLPDGESIALLHAKGGGYFDYAKAELARAGIPYVTIQKQSVWPKGPEQVALSTLHSAKGLEFDHVVILGLSEEVLPHGPEDDDTELINNRRLLAMGITRGRETAAITYKPEEAPGIIGLLSPDTFDGIDV